MSNWLLLLLEHETVNISYNQCTLWICEYFLGQIIGNKSMIKINSYVLKQSLCMAQIISK